MPPATPVSPAFLVDQGLEYYAGKSELLDWVNRLLDLQLARVEQLTSGAVYCQILDAFCADAVAIRKVNFLAREEYEILPNYKLLQAAFTTLGYTKELDVAKLSHASASDLMEFAQWLYRHFKGVNMVAGYNPAARRQISLKGAASSIPLPSCLNNTAFDFGRSADLRVSGNWATPQEAVRAPWNGRPGTGTPASTGGRHGGGGGGGGAGTTAPGTAGSTAKRTMPNLNVGSRYREGLTVPSEHHERRNTRLSPVAPAPPLPLVPVGHSGTQTDFVDEEYRSMTAADVGTEAVAPRSEVQQDHGQQYEQGQFGYGYGYSLGASGGIPERSASNSTAGSLTPHGGGFGFGAHPISTPTAAALGAAGGVFGHQPSFTAAAAEVNAFAAAPPLSTQGDVAAAPEPWLTGATGGLGSGGGEGLQARWDGEDSADVGGYVVAALPGPSPRDAAGGGIAPAHPARGGHGFGMAAVAASFRGMADPEGKGVSPAGAAFDGASCDEDDGPVGVRPENGYGGEEAEELVAGVAVVGAEWGEDPQLEAAALVSADAEAEGLASPAGTDAEDEVEVRTAVSAALEGADAEEAEADAATVGTPTGRSSGGALAGLPPEVASLLASPGFPFRGRSASAASLRNMSTALEVAAAALAAAGRALESFALLLVLAAAAPRPPPAAASPGAEAGGSVADEDGEGAGACSLTLIGKARSLQDVLQTLLAHTGLLLLDVQAHSGATMQAAWLPPVASEGGEGGGSSAAPLGGSDAAGAGGREVGLGPVEGPPRNYHAEAAQLLELARACEGRLLTLGQQSVQALQPHAQPQAHAASPSAHGTRTAAPSSGAAAAARRHLSDEQRRLCSTAQVDGHLKAVGMAQFALVQGVHKELAAFSASFFKPGGAGDGGGAGSGRLGSRDGGRFGRKARVFKLGQYQLKQLRNGDVYKGRYVGSKKNGEGVYQFINADVYEGEFSDDRMDGHGVYTFSHEGRYEGQWRNAVYNGTGAETFAKGSTYRGEYAGGLRNGWGVCRFYNGDYYEGQWAKGLRDGSGMQQCTDDSNFVGDYVRGKRHGHGVYSFPNGDCYEGAYAEDLPHGTGTYHFASGQCYQGQWRSGKKHGWSVYTVDNGSRFMGLWADGKPTWVHPLSEAQASGQAGASATASEEDRRQLRQALAARDEAAKAAEVARECAAEHWGSSGLVQTHVLSALSRAAASAAVSQQARRKACELAARLDAAVGLLQAGGGGGAEAAVSQTP